MCYNITKEDLVVAWTKLGYNEDEVDRLVQACEFVPTLSEISVDEASQALYLQLHHNTV